MREDGPLTRSVLAGLIVIELVLGVAAAAAHDSSPSVPRPLDTASTSTTLPSLSETTGPTSQAALTSRPSGTTRPTAGSTTTRRAASDLAVYGDPDSNHTSLRPAGPDHRGHTWTLVAGGTLPDSARWQVDARRQGDETCLSVTVMNSAGTSGGGGGGCNKPPFAAGGGSSGASIYQYADGIAPKTAATVVLTTRDGRSGRLKIKDSLVSDVRIFWGFFDCEADMARVEAFDSAGKSVGRFDYPMLPAGFEPVCRRSGGS